jgi:hypothetical protein
VIPDEVAIRRDPPGGCRMRLDPASLEKPRRADVALREHVEDAVADPRGVEPVGVLGVEGQGDADGGYFSTPLITMPRVKNRWKTRKIRIGMIIVISVPAWMNA